MANTHVERRSTSLATRETVVETTVRTCTHLSNSKTEGQRQLPVLERMQSNTLPGTAPAATWTALRDHAAALRECGPSSQGSTHSHGTDPGDLEPCVHTETCPPAFTAASCATAPARKLPRQPWTGEGLRTVKPHSVKERNKLSIDATS